MVGEGDVDELVRRAMPDVAPMTPAERDRVMALIRDRIQQEALEERQRANERIVELEGKLEHFARLAATNFREINELTEQCAAFRVEARAQARRAQLAVDHLQAARLELDELKTRIALEIRTATGAMTAIVDQAIGEGI